MYRSVVGGRSDCADFSAGFVPTASFCGWAINTHLGRGGKVAGAPLSSIEPRASLSYSSVHVLY